MQTASIKLHNPGFAQGRTYMLAALFVIGNILLPQICHLMPHGGFIFLPIYFFTLVGAYKYGWRVGILTALASPLVNSALFGMPAAAMLPVIMLKSTLLAAIAGIVAGRYGKATLLSIAGVVLGYQLLGTLGEWAICGSLAAAVSDLTTGIPGILLQIFGGYAAIRYLK